MEKNLTVIREINIIKIKTIFSNILTYKLITINIYIS